MADKSKKINVPLSASTLLDLLEHLSEGQVSDSGGTTNLTAKKTIDHKPVVNAVTETLRADFHRKSKLDPANTAHQAEIDRRTKFADGSDAFDEFATALHKVLQLTCCARKNCQPNCPICGTNEICPPDESLPVGGV
jgi:hypothetical protein